MDDLQEMEQLMCLLVGTASKIVSLIDKPENIVAFRDNSDNYKFLRLLNYKGIGEDLTKSIATLEAIKMFVEKF